MNARTNAPIADAAKSLFAGDTETIAAHVVALSIFPDVRAKVIIAESWTWGEVVFAAEQPDKTHKTKSACPLIKFATFGDKRTASGCLRSDENMLSVSGIEGDYDDGLVTPAEAAARLGIAGVEAVVYTTPSHTAAKPRWRVLAPLSRTYKPGERAHFVALLNRALGGILAPESFTASQIYYFGKVEGARYEVHHVAGAYVDCLETRLSAEQSDRAGEVPPPHRADNELEPSAVLAQVTDQTISDLQSALVFVDNVDRTMWVNTLHALKGLGAIGYALGQEYSQRDCYAFDQEEFDRVWESAKPNHIDFRWVFNRATEKGWQNPRKGQDPQTQGDYSTRVDYTDTGNANLLAKLIDGNLRWVPERRSWLLWDGSRWVVDQFGAQAHAAALSVAHYYYDEAAELENKLSSDVLDEGARKHLRKAIDRIRGWERHCRNKRAIDAMLATAEKNPKVQINASELDQDHWLLGVANGVVDLRTGLLRPAAREDFVTKRSPVRYNTEAVPPRFLQFIDEITATSAGVSRPDLANYIQRALGYCLSGSTAEAKMFLAIGVGANGKNVLLDTFQRVAGDYCSTIPAGALMATRSNDAERASPIAASLAGVRAAVSSESKDGQKLDVALVKLHTGGGFMVARFMRENIFRFEITHKLWLMTNHKPALDHLDDAMRGRLHLIPFDRQWNRPGHPDRDPALPDGDKNLMEKLKAEDAGILAWLVAGAVAYANEGLEPPAEVVRMTQQYFKDEDVLGRWLEGYEQCEAKNGSAAATLYADLKRWREEEGLSESLILSMTAFSQALGKRGYEKHIGKDAKRYGLRPRVQLTAE